MRFFDASALVKRYIRETGSAQVRRLLSEGGVVVSRLSEIEVVSAFARLAREEEISRLQRDRAVAAFVEDLASWHVIEVTATVTATARRLLLQHSLRAGDALQLAGALEVQTRTRQPLQAFVAFDQRLLVAAREEQLILVAPTR